MLLYDNINNKGVQNEIHNHYTTTGIYKTREVRLGGRDGRLLTEAELLKNEIDTMKLHIIHMQDIQEDLIPSENEV